MSFNIITKIIYIEKSIKKSSLILFTQQQIYQLFYEWHLLFNHLLWLFVLLKESRLSNTFWNCKQNHAIMFETLVLVLFHKLSFLNVWSYQYNRLKIITNVSLLHNLLTDNLVQFDGPLFTIFRVPWNFVPNQYYSDMIYRMIQNSQKT